ncbi:Gfo/Idh/MocA family protein [Pseudoclavibacter sp. AY1H1]|uniref:Gfo/Idh/MocA family protein n=1 Tax=Pseudoclavibacter sp. AY1H1 TaxID=2080584 RepID=UPI000CE77CF7|nr:Gfo/Idh/MocA family oxidoreductase [Pseudoclavibacter sp. AY1H1]PPF33794.1 oxidoreductase [Pseudoclavibacter sp. AY1H1]
MSRQNTRRLSAGMVGGGIGADIGKTHRFGMRLDDRYALDAGVFGRDRGQSAEVAASLGVAPERSYASYQEMAEVEATRADGVDVVIVATPNDTHFEVAKAFLERGIHVVCEKPLTQDSATARELVELAAASGAILAVPHCYSAYPMVREAARMVSDGRLGRLTFVDVEHASGWATTPLELTGHKQASWRTDPDIAGFPSVVGDLGTHAYHLARYITGLEVEQVSAQLHTLVPGRRVFDNATVALRLADDTPGRLWASMAATGHNHGLRIRVFGDEGSLEWRHEDPHHLTFQDLEGTTTIFTHGLASLSEDSARLTRVGLGHPEGFLEAFGNFYRDLADELEARRDARGSTVRELSFPTGIDGLIGVQFVEAVAASHAADGAWTVPASVADRDAEVAAADAELREAGGK